MCIVKFLCSCPILYMIVWHVYQPNIWIQRERSYDCTAAYFLRIFDISLFCRWMSPLVLSALSWILSIWSFWRWISSPKPKASPRSLLIPSDISPVWDELYAWGLWGGLGNWNGSFRGWAIDIGFGGWGNWNVAFGMWGNWNGAFRGVAIGTGLWGGAIGTGRLGVVSGVGWYTEHSGNCRLIQCFHK